jgi:hopene-associated glycosyltransferase HpnB
LALAITVLLAWVYLFCFHGRFWHAGPVLTPTRPPAFPDVAVVVPARDEAAVIEASLTSLLAQDYAGSFRVILVDDNSEDATGDIARGIGDPRLTVLTGAPRPAGWAGKLWAVRQGLALTGDSEFVLLTDADIVHHEAHLSTLIAKAMADDLDLVSEMVILSRETWAERALVPAFVFFFQLLYPFSWVNDPARATAAAAGGTMLLRRRALRRVNGVDAVRGALIDDVALAAAVKPGGAIFLGHSILARSVRSYPAIVDIWRMVARSAYVQLRFSPLLLLTATLSMTLVWLAPMGLALLATGPARGLGLAAWLMMTMSFLPTLRRFAASPAWALTLPCIALFYMAATIGSALNHYRGRGVAWKGRAYQNGGA